MTLEEFLLAQIAKDEARARDEAVLRDGDPYYAPEGLEQSEFDRHINPARVLAECEAKRRIVNGWIDPFGEWTATQAAAAAQQKARTLRLLALPYADHPAFQEEWRL